jgi:hypothetical protein
LNNFKGEYQEYRPSRVLVRATETDYVDERICERRCAGGEAMKVGLSYLEENLAALRLDVRRLEKVLSSAARKQMSC